MKYRIKNTSHNYGYIRSINRNEDYISFCSGHDGPHLYFKYHIARFYLLKNRLRLDTHDLTYKIEIYENDN